MGAAHARLWRAGARWRLTEARAPVRPADAATLILLDHSGKAPRVLMGRRHAGHKFMPGKFVFPGGRLEPSDRRMAIAGPLDELIEEKLNARARRASQHLGRALALAALRETFEETGLAIGARDCGAPENPPDGVWARFAATGVFPALDGLDFLARAITPPGRTKRFDTRFLVADAASIAYHEEGAVHAEAELVELVWIELAKTATLDLPEITRVVLKDLTIALAGGMSRFRPRPFYHQMRGQWLREEL